MKGVRSNVQHLIHLLDEVAVNSRLVNSLTAEEAREMKTRLRVLNLFFSRAALRRNMGTD